MTSSSAYSNVLLKPSVQSQPAAAPKRDYQDDFSTTDFSQTFKDVHDTERDEKIAKPAAKKSAAVPSREKPSEVASDKKPVDSADKSDAGCVASDKKDIADDTPVKDKESKKADDSIDPSAVAQTNSPQPVAAQPAASSEINIALTGLVADAEKSTENPAVDGVSMKPDASVNTNQNLDNETTAVALNSVDADPVADVLSQDKTIDTSKLAKDSKTKDAETAVIPLVASADLQQSAAQQIIGDSAAEQTASQAAQQSVATLATAATAVNSPLANSNTSSTDVAEDALGAVVADLLSEKTTAKTATVDANSTAKSEPETEGVVFQASDSKSVFEKMLQTVARSASPVQDDKVATTPAQTTSSTSSTALDSLARFNDTQTPAARSFVAQTAVPVPVGQPQWSQAVGEKVLWLAAQNISSAEINLHPKDLGPVQVRVSVNQEQTTVSFTSHHPVVREVLDQNLNRLRDMFSEQGLNLVNVDVSDKSFSRQQGEAKDQKGQGGNNATPEEETLVAVTSIVQQRLVDHYA